MNSRYGKLAMLSKRSAWQVYRNAFAQNFVLKRSNS